MPKSSGCRGSRNSSPRRCSVDLGKYSKAREQFTAIDPLPIADVLDHEYKREAKQVLEDIKGEKDET